MRRVGSSQQTSNGRIRVFKAIPDGSQRAKSQPAWMVQLDHTLAEQHDLGAIRCDAADNVRKIAWILCRHTDWRTLVARPGWNLLAELTGLSESTVNRALRRLRAWGLLGVVETGSTWRTRGCDIDDEDGNRGAEYVLCVPAHEPVEISDRPSSLRMEAGDKPLRGRASEHPSTATTAPWPMHQTPKTRGDMLHATQRLQQQAPMLNRISDKRLRHVLRPVFAAGWSPAQVRYALDHAPDGTARWHTADVRHPAAWVKHRLTAWRRGDGTWATPPVQLGAGRTTDLGPADVAALPRADAPPVTDTTTHASAARQMLADTLRNVTRKQPAKRGLGVNLPADGLAVTVTEPREHLVDAGRNPFAVDDPRHGYAADADADAASGWLLRNAARQARQNVAPVIAGEGFEWLRRGLERRAAGGGAGAVA
ncbi:MAG: hypothetical protein JWN00_1459 [Actinomycetia bacterium]|nr:hypothetical protein [Actinomycetes bacterium]